MKTKLIILAFTAFVLNANVLANKVTDSLLQILNEKIEMRSTFLKQKEEKIASLKSKLQNADKNNFLIQNNLYKELYSEYRTFQFDSAFAYSFKLIKNAHQSGNKATIDDSRIKASFILLSSGLFKETLDTLAKISVKPLHDSLKREYYYILARTYFDMADYTGDSYYAPLYNNNGKKMLDSAIMFCKDSSMTFLSFHGLKYLRNGEMKKARECYEKLLKIKDLDKHQYAIEASSLSFIYKFDNEPNLSEQMLIRAAIFDIETSTKETVAIRQLAEILFKHDDIESAYKFVKAALEDAYYYGARHRKVQVSDILPSIEDRQLEIVQTQRRTFLIYSVLTTVLSLIIVGFAFIIFRQLKKLRKAQKYMTAANKKLSDMNKKLIEANRIKEEYIGQFFDAISGYINRFEKIKTSIGRKITTHQVEDIKDIISGIDIKDEREQFYNKFDSIFLKIFPNFIESFNSLLKDDSLKLEPGMVLTPEVRIYALIRLGISDNEKIARFLGYTLNTIYAYKTKIKNKVNLSMEEFEKKLMRIEAV